MWPGEWSVTGGRLALPAMPTSRPLSAIGALIAVLTIAGCRALIPGPEPLSGGRRWIITVDN